MGNGASIHGTNRSVCGCITPPDIVTSEENSLAKPIVSLHAADAKQRPPSRIKLSTVSLIASSFSSSDGDSEHQTNSRSYYPYYHQRESCCEKRNDAEECSSYSRCQEEVRE